VLFRSNIDNIIMGIVDILMAFPSILLAIVVISILGPGLNNAILASAIVAIPNFTRLVRSQVMVEKNKDYHLAAISTGASSKLIIFKEIFPNIVSPLIVQTTLGFSEAILNTAALGFLGLGAQPPLPEWVIMLSDARPFIVSSPWLVTIPGLCIFLVLLGFNLLGDGLREITAIISNQRLMPTHSSQDLKFKIEKPDLVSITGIKPIAGMIVENRDLNISTEQKTDPSILNVPNIPGLGSITVRWIVSGSGKYTITVDSRKGGAVSKSK